eukprot:Rhum_TRINITY_DN15212_c12_g1::Rhum_TRINITY_DN15212_c12_g1_i1::g.144892::m.144892
MRCVTALWCGKVYRGCWRLEAKKVFFVGANSGASRRRRHLRLTVVVSAAVDAPAALESDAHATRVQDVIERLGETLVRRDGLRQRHPARRGNRLGGLLPRLLRLVLQLCLEVQLRLLEVLVRLQQLLRGNGAVGLEVRVLLLQTLDALALLVQVGRVQLLLLLDLRAQLVHLRLVLRLHGPQLRRVGLALRTLALQLGGVLARLVVLRLVLLLQGEPLLEKAGALLRHGIDLLLHVLAERLHLLALLGVQRVQRVVLLAAAAADLFAQRLDDGLLLLELLLGCSVPLLVEPLVARRVLDHVLRLLQGPRLRVQQRLLLRPPRLQRRQLRSARLALLPEVLGGLPRLLLDALLLLTLPLQLRVHLLLLHQRRVLALRRLTHLLRQVVDLLLVHGAGGVDGLVVARVRVLKRLLVLLRHGRQLLRVLRRERRDAALHLGRRLADGAHRRRTLVLQLLHLLAKLCTRLRVPHLLALHTLARLLQLALPVLALLCQLLVVPHLHLVRLLHLARQAVEHLVAVRLCAAHGLHQRLDVHAHGRAVRVRAVRLGELRDARARLDQRVLQRRLHRKKALLVALRLQLHLRQLLLERLDALLALLLSPLGCDELVLVALKLQRALGEPVLHVVQLCLRAARRLVQLLLPLVLPLAPLSLLLLHVLVQVGHDTHDVLQVRLALLHELVLLRLHGGLVLPGQFLQLLTVRGGLPLQLVLPLRLVVLVLALKVLDRAHERLHALLQLLSVALRRLRVRVQLHLQVVHLRGHLVLL